MYLIYYADSAEVLHKGVFSLDISFFITLTLILDKCYKPDGDLEDIAIDYNTELQSGVFPALSALDPLVGGTGIEVLNKERGK